LLLQLSLSFALASAAASPTWRLSAEPADAAESALREAALHDGRAGIDALRAVARQYPDSAAEIPVPVLWWSTDTVNAVSWLSVLFRTI
jgi:hypothetical protein